MLDVTGDPMWLNGAQSAFRAEADRSYLVVAPEAVLRPEVRPLVQNTLKSNDNQADYLLISPRAMLDVAQPLLDWRSEQGLTVMAVPVEEVYQEFGFGEERPEAVRDFLAYAYHQRSAPSPRYVLLLGDATLDPKDYLQTGLTNQVPSPPVKTSFTWTVSDPSYAAVNGEDVLPDLAIGRLPAATVEEAQVLVADNPDPAGDFEANAEDIATGVFAERDPTKIYLGELGAHAAHEAIVGAFDEGASIVSYIGHGGIDLWADEKIFKNAHVEGLAPQSQQPLLLTLNCLNGYFTFPHFNSLSEELMKAEGKVMSPQNQRMIFPSHKSRRNARHGTILSEASSDFVQDCRRGHKNEFSLFEQALEYSIRWTLRPNQSADEDIRIDNDSMHFSACIPPSFMLGGVGKLIGFSLGERAFLSFKKGQQVTPSSML